MASLFPFRALRYDPERVRLADVVTQPYDKITPAMQERYYAASLYNLVRIVLGNPRVEAGDVYQAAQQHFSDWRANRILKRDPEPSLYPYSQTFKAPDGTPMERRGFLALGRLHDYEEGVVHRHEQTLSAPKADRLKLLRATRAHFEQLFLLYSDPQREVEALLFDTGDVPQVQLTDEYGVLHRFWSNSDAAILSRVTSLMAEKKLIIADGHHRYETALNYRNERRKAASDRDDNAPYERVLMTFVNMDSPGLLILPTHRVVHSLAMFDPEQLLRGAKRYFEVAALPADVDAAAAMHALRPGEPGMRFVAFCGERNFVFSARPEALPPLLAGLSSRQQSLDVVVLHRVLLQKVLGISEEAIREQRNLAYLRDAAEALARVRAGQADAAFLVNPVTTQQMHAIAFAGEVMPQKSTDFYPKLLSGLAVYALE